GMVQTCAKCSRANPEDAVYCYHDGFVLNAQRAGGPVAVGAQAFLTPFVFPNGRSCRNFNEFALACQENWDDACNLLQKGFLESFLGGLGRLDLAQAAREAAKFPDRSRGLDQLLAKLPTDVLDEPKLRIEPQEMNLGVVEPGQDRTFTLHLDNQGMRLLYGSVTVEGCNWITVGEAPGGGEKIFQFGHQLATPLHLPPPPPPPPP